MCESQCKDRVKFSIHSEISADLIHSKIINPVLSCTEASGDPKPPLSTPEKLLISQDKADLTLHVNHKAEHVAEKSLIKDRYALSDANIIT